MLLYVCSLLFEQDISYYTSLFNTNINICVYVHPDILRLGYPDLNSAEHPNVLFMVMPELSEFNLVQYMNSVEWHANSVQLPQHRNEEKDTYEYIVSSHFKYDLLQRTIHVYKEQFPDIDLTHIAWIENSMLYTFVESPEIWTREVSPLLAWFSTSPLHNRFITLPGCKGWSPINESNMDVLWKEVYWRFCGGFLMGDCKTVANFCTTYMDAFIDWMDKKNTLIWDFNMLAYLEYRQQKVPNKLPIFWYSANHNYTILHCSSDLFTRPVKPLCKVEHPYTNYDSFYPSSASYTVDVHNKHWLNTRYVNYWIYPNGYYLFHNPTRTIENKNILSELDPHTLCPISFKEINTDALLPIETKKHISVGLEDIRLFQHNKKTHYIATTFEYTKDDKGQIITGIYNTDTGTVEENELIESPTNQSIEKNWVPIHDDVFVYKWSPITIGTIDKQSRQFRILHEIENRHPICKHARGSSPFISTDVGYLAVVHYSEEHSPRHYYHMMVLLHKETYAIIRFSKTFCFESLGIEFCIGFTIKESNYVFWISRHDRSPVQLMVPFTEIKW